MPMPSFMLRAKLLLERGAVHEHLEPPGRLPIPGTPVARPHPDVPLPRFGKFDLIVDGRKIERVDADADEIADVVHSLEVPGIKKA